MFELVIIGLLGFIAYKVSDTSIDTGKIKDDTKDFCSTFRDKYSEYMNDIR